MTVALPLPELVVTPAGDRVGYFEDWEPRMLWTIVQSPRYVRLRDERYKSAVSEYSITEDEAELVRKVGGVVFRASVNAMAYAFMQNFPHGVLAPDQPPAAPGTFAQERVKDLPVYIPPPEEAAAGE